MKGAQQHKRIKAIELIRTPWAFVWNMAMVYIVYGLCRLIYWAENAQTFTGLWTENRLSDLLTGAWMFDSSAILYTNVFYALLMLVPLHWKESRGWQTVAKWVFLLVNSLMVVINLADAVYFQYTGRRTTASVFNEFSNEGNLMDIFAVEALRHWYLVLAGVILIWGLWKGYKRGGNATSDKQKSNKGSRTKALLYYGVQAVCLLAFIPLCISGMRGGFSHAVRPITISNANQYVSRPVEAAFVLNTPFSLIRTWGKKPFVEPNYFQDETTMSALYTPLHTPTDSTMLRRKNVVILIIESLGQEYIGALNANLEDGKYQGYTPFTDSLLAQSLTWEQTFANGRKSIDAMPSILSSIPMFVEPFFLTPASMNTVGGLARELKNMGYSSAFFHGAENGSMGFQAFARATGFDAYYGRTEYNADPRYNGDADFDGMWAIWDEPFLQFMATQLEKQHEPFLASVFTASSHHPFAIPVSYRDSFPEGPLPIHKCIRYTDHALRRFFETASKQPWYKNTIFVLTADHTNLSNHTEYQTDLGLYRAPILFFDPSGEMPRGTREGIAQQIDIMPTLLGWLGYPKPYIAFGCDLFATPSDETWAVSYNNGIYQYVKHHRLLQFDGQQARALYHLDYDPYLQSDYIGRDSLEVSMTQELKSLIQQYMKRMNGDELVLERPHIHN